MDETSRAARWLVAVLRGDAGLTALAPGGVWEDPAPRNQGFPRIVFAMLSSVEVEGHANNRLYTDSLWLVRAVVQGGSYTDATDIADRVDELLHGADGSVSDAHVYSTKREGSVRFAEVLEGITYRHLGGQYRIYIQGND